MEDRITIRPRILGVENDDVSRHVLIEFLRQFDCETHIARDGVEGLEVLEGDRAHGALRGRRGLEAGQGEGRHAEARAEPRPSSEPAPKALPFASTTRAPPETGPGAPKRLRAGSRAALVPDWRLDEAAAGRDPDLPIRSRGLALRRS